MWKRWNVRRRWSLPQREHEPRLHRGVLQRRQQDLHAYHNMQRHRSLHDRRPTELWSISVLNDGVSQDLHFASRLRHRQLLQHTRWRR
jgi:hypothetical protein